MRLGMQSAKVAVWQAVLCLALAVTLVTPFGRAAAAVTFPDLRPGIVQDERSNPWQGADQERLSEALAQLTPVQWKVALVQSAGGRDPSDFIDGLFDHWQLGSESLLIVVFEAEGRFRAMSGIAGINGDMITRQAMVHYVPLANQGRVAEGIMAFAEALWAERYPDSLPPRAPEPASEKEAAAPPGEAAAAPGEPVQTPQPPQAGEKRPSRGFPWGWTGAGVLILVVLALIGRRSQREARRGAGQRG